MHERRGARIGSGRSENDTRESRQREDMRARAGIQGPQRGHGIGDSTGTGSRARKKGGGGREKGGIKKKKKSSRTWRKNNVRAKLDVCKKRREKERSQDRLRNVREN